MAGIKGLLNVWYFKTLLAKRVEWEFYSIVGLTSISPNQF